MAKALALAAALVLFGSTPGSAAPRDSIVGLPAWDRVATPSGALFGVHALSPSDVWVVGSTNGRTLTEHGNGSAFAVVSSPNRPDRSNVLEDVDGVATNDLWAVGHSDVTDFIGALTLAEHWDGTRWSIVRTPNVGRNSTQDELTGVATIAADDAWAVGTATDFSPGGVPLAFHWDGARWTRVANHCGFGLHDVDALASNDVWAVGGSDTCHWDGVSWTRVPVAPDPSGQGYVNLRDVTVVSPTNAWAVGIVSFSCGEGQVCSSGVIQHWNGTKWRYVLTSFPVLYGVDAVSANDVWAVGLGYGAAIVHYDGQRWSDVPSGVGQGELAAVEASVPNDVWAAGDTGNGAGASLVEHAPSSTSGAVAGGSNVGGATISWFGPESGSVETDPFGDYQVGGLTAGTYRFTATYSGCQPASAKIAVVAGTTIGHDFHLGC